MTNTLDDRALAERMEKRIAREHEFARTGRKLRNKNWLFRREKTLVRPVIRFGLHTLLLYKRGMRNALRPVVRKLEITFDRLPAAFDGYTLMHLSDFHIDGVPDLVAPLTSLLRSYRPDLCVVTGDYRYDDEGSCEHVYPLMRKVISSISARDGVFGILGNHDVAEIAIALDKMGLRMLINESVEIQRGGQSIWLTGVDDPFDYKCDDLLGALAPVPSDAFKILLAHTPELYESAASLDVDLYLSGHTHAGQIRFPFIGSIRNNANCPPAYAYGHWQHETMHGYTSAGIGCSSLPIRYNCPPEIVLIQLRSR